MSAASGAPSAPEPEPPEQTLAREQRQRPAAAVAAVIAAVCPLVAALVAAGVLRDRPRVLLVDALRDAAGQPLPGGREGLRTAQILFYDERAFRLLAAAVISALGALALIVALGYLYRATRARRPQTPQVAIVMAVSGAVMAAVGGLVLQIAVTIEAGDFASAGDFSSAAARDAFEGGFLVAAQIVSEVAKLAIGFGFVMIALYAMRAGLLTRFMGTLGIIVGVLFVIPLGSQLPVVQTFWLLAVAALFMGRWPQGVPPAWATGRAEPWPSQQELREARERAQGAGGEALERPHGLRRKRAAEPEPEPLDSDAPEAPAGKEHPASKKKKRRRR